MKCQVCGAEDSRVVDSRPSQDGAIRRRRECSKCGHRFTTYEKIETTPMIVVKRDGRREYFESQKIKTGIIHACQNLPITIGEIDEMVNHVEQEVLGTMTDEISSQQIGDMVMTELKKRNDVAYVRFAAVYRKFTDLESLMEEMQKLLEENKKKK